MGYAQELLAQDERLLELCGVVHDHLDPVRLFDPLLLRHDNGGPAVINLAGRLSGSWSRSSVSPWPSVLELSNRGGLYYWAAKARRQKQCRWSWITGWFNLLGKWRNSGIDFGLAFFVNYFLSLFILSGRRR